MKKFVFLSAVLLLAAACGSGERTVISDSPTPVATTAPPAVEPTPTAPTEEPTAPPGATPAPISTPTPRPAPTTAGTPGPLPTLIPAPTTVPSPTAIPSPTAVPSDEARRAYQTALARWQERGSANYDYSFTLNCFCSPDDRGPFQVSVRGGQVVSATLNGTDVLDLPNLNIDSYQDRILTVDGVFEEIDRAIDEAASLTTKYDQALGVPTSVFIDWSLAMADEEIGYEINDLLIQPTNCSTTGSSISLTPQQGLPQAVAAKRQAIYAAAMACDIDGLVALTSADGFKASFGGGGPKLVWTGGEAAGQQPLLAMVQHLNLAFSNAASSDATIIWPSAFKDLESADGAGLSPVDYQALLELYSRDELQNMFDGIGAYVGHRLGITPTGEWTFFLAGD